MEAKEFRHTLSDGRTLIVERRGPMWLWSIRETSGAFRAFGQELIAGKCVSQALEGYPPDERYAIIEALEDWRERAYPLEYSVHVAVYSDGSGDYVTEIVVGNYADVPVASGRFDTLKCAIEFAAGYFRG